ncbi:MAG: hypothetical protein ACI9XO_000751 [Paraglaciecola sp.]|jgi:hypothetical protein
MQLFPSNTPVATYEIVLNLYEITTGLFLPTAYVVRRDKVGDLTHLKARAHENTVESYGIGLTPLRKKTLEYVAKLQTKALEVKFSPPRKRQQLFAKLLEIKEVKSQIVKYAQRELAELLKLAVEHKVPIAWDVERKTLVKDLIVEPAKTSLEPVLNFHRTDAGMRYWLQFREEGKVWNIQSKEVIPITNTPAWIFVNYELFLVDGINGNMVKPFCKKEEVNVPESAIKTYFQKFVVKQAAKLDIQAEGFSIEKNEGLRGCELEVTMDFFTGKFGLNIHFKYAHSTFLWNDPKQQQTYVSFDGAGEEVVIHQTARDQVAESIFLGKLATIGFEKGKGNFWQLIDNQEDKYYLLEWVGENQAVLKKAGFTLIDTKIDNKKLVYARPKMEQRVVKGNDWFDIFIEIVVGEFRIPFHKLIPFIRNENRFYPLPNGEFFLIPQEWMTRFQSIARFCKKEGEALRLAKSHFALLDDLNLDDDSEKADWRTLDFEPSKMLKATLRPYQLEGAKWLVAHYQNDLGACLADDMGLGKTLQTLTVLLHAKEQKGIADKNVQNSDSQIDMFSKSDDLKFLKPLNALIVLPASLVFNWENEIKKFAPSLTTYRQVGAKRHKDARLLVRYDVILTTYQTALKDAKLLQEIEFEYMVLDESHYIKNKNSKIFKALREFKARHKVSLSGTPIENSLKDLWSQMDFINSGHLGSANFFQKEFITPIERGGNEDKKEQLRALVSPFLMRRTKEEVAKDLPELDVQVFYSEMTLDQRKIYEREKSKARNLLLQNYKSGSFEYASIVLQTLLKLRQIVNHPKLVFPDYDKSSGKFQDILEQWGTIQKSGHKTLIFSSFVKHLELVRGHFEGEKAAFSWLTGAVSQKQRAVEVTNFQEKEDVSSFLISTKAGGTGLNLTAADYVFLIDPWWNPQAEKQAIARAHRIGQTKKVFARKFITKDSIEEKILALQERKAALAEDILTGAGKQVFSKSDLEFLLV